ncbi:error-prone DNA polymerase [Curvibacter sp. HBC61]|uniref:Error-prone DNA polymerase n=1 Tax=Curvibacter cyanobacteriorum TaxID=3026422 RepID=A0ABT5MX51_9BURK|nr:error-prone DNA polymerase [Curvibacter sp. HBC61]MDD0838636.1 error-prone DNA polymerase [Curvibacter sp. HBC61]
MTLPPSTGLPAYAELQACSNFSFLRGASTPAELIDRAQALGYSALALTDECSLAGVVQAHARARECGLPLLIGAQFALDAETLAEGAVGAGTLVLLAQHRRGYAQLCSFITRVRAGHPKGAYQVAWADLLADPRRLDGCLALWNPQRAGAPDTAALTRVARRLAQAFASRAWLAVTQTLRMDDARWLEALREAADPAGLPLVACGAVLMHRRSRKPLQDVLTSLRLRRPVADCGLALQPNAEGHLRSRARLARLLPPALLEESVRIAQRCRFSLDELRYEYPQEVVPAGLTPTDYLRQCVAEGERRRYPDGTPAPVQAQLAHELALISELAFETYFLTVYDVVQFARRRHILCQGRGSAANSAVCYCLGITEVDPARSSLLFERFISRARREPPDIDVDFEHQRREEVIQYLYAKYGRARAALVAVVIRYRLRSAIRDVGFALGVAPAVVDALASRPHEWGEPATLAQRLVAQGAAAEQVRLPLWQALVEQLLGFPRHLSQHPGGFVLTGDRLDATVPVVHASMAGRTCIEWDKDDIDTVGLLKVDVLALGMLSALQRAFMLIGQWRGRPFTLSEIPEGDRPTYDMLCRADTVGVFQVESRAQQSMLPRLRPRCFYDLVVQVAIVRPGPIQGGMVHPYLRRRQGLEPAEGPPGLEAALGRTLGVPIFQEQVMQIAMDAAGFSADEADQLRRGMAAWKRKGGLQHFQDRLLQGMTARGYSPEFAEAIFQQMLGFGEYGFPESHAASFALLAYASAWVKQHHPACFLAALLNSQPMGFYGPAQLVQDARRHGVTVRPVDVLHSDWLSTLEPLGPEADAAVPAVRLGLNRVKGLGEAVARRIVRLRRQGQPMTVQGLARSAELDAGDLATLASADALASLAGHRRQQVWEGSALRQAPALLREAPVHEAELTLPAPGEAEDVLFDYAATGLSLRRHPLALLRPTLDRQRLFTAAQLQHVRNGHLVRACGLVTVRQRPGTAKGTVFVTLEDETGCINVIVWPQLREQQRAALLESTLLAVDGQWQREGDVAHLIARRLKDLTPLLQAQFGALAPRSRDFH